MTNTVEPRYNEVIGTMKIPLLYQVSHYIRVKKQRNIKNWVQQNYLVIRGFCYIRPLYNEVPLYMALRYHLHLDPPLKKKKKIPEKLSIEIWENKENNCYMYVNALFKYKHWK